MFKFFTLFILCSSAIASEPRSVQVSWSCPEASVERLQGEQQITVSVDDRGSVRLRPDILRVNPSIWNRLTAFTRRRGAAGDISRCLTTFTQNIERACQGTSCPQGFKEIVSDRLGRSRFAQTTPPRPRLPQNNLNERLSETRQEGRPVPTFELGEVPAEAETEARKEITKILSQNYRASAGNVLGATFSHGGRQYPLRDFDNYLGAVLASPRFNENDRKMMLQSYLLSRADYLAPDREFRRRFCRSESACQKATARREAIRSNIRVAVARIQGNQDDELYQQCLEGVMPTELRSIAQVLNTRTGENDCSDLAAGSQRLMNEGRSQFLLKRLPNGDHEAILNIDFHADSPELPARLAARMRECFQTSAPFMKGADGSRLHVKIISPEEAERTLPADVRPGASRIKVWPNGNGAANTENIGVTNACPTIMHEMLHHLGLHDEYHSNEPEARCRIVPTQASIMKNDISLHQAVPRVSTCQCGPGCKSIMNGRSEQLKSLYLGQTAAEVLTNYPIIRSGAQDNSGNNCQFGVPVEVRNPASLPNPNHSVIFVGETPQNFTIEERTVRQDLKVYKTTITCRHRPELGQSFAYARTRVKDWTRNPSRTALCPGRSGYISTATEENTGTYGQLVEPTVQGNTLTFSNQPPLKSLLHPNQFNRIIHGNCPGKSGQYEECGSWAYKFNNEACAAPSSCTDSNNFQGVSR